MKKVYHTDSKAYSGDLSHMTHQGVSYDSFYLYESVFFLTTDRVEKTAGLVIS